MIKCKCVAIRDNGCGRMYEDWIVESCAAGAEKPAVQITIFDKSDKLHVDLIMSVKNARKFIQDLEDLVETMAMCEAYNSRQRRGFES